MISAARKENQTNQITIAPHPDHEHIRTLIAKDWDRPGQDIEARPLILWPIADSLGDITHVCMAISGTPWRGIALVPLGVNELATRSGFAAMVLSRKETRVLRDFSRRMLGCEESR